MLTGEGDEAMAEVNPGTVVQQMRRANAPLVFGSLRCNSGLLGRPVQFRYDPRGPVHQRATKAFTTTL
jgi:hypothetical protein